MNAKQRYEIRKRAQDTALDEFRKDLGFIGAVLRPMEVARLETAVSAAAARAAEVVISHYRKVQP